MLIAERAHVKYPVSHSHHSLYIPIIIIFIIFGRIYTRAILTCANYRRLITLIRTFVKGVRVREVVWKGFHSYLRKHEENIVCETKILYLLMLHISHMYEIL